MRPVLGTGLGARAMLALLAVTILPANAAAQLDEGARHLADADFERAERAFDRALLRGELSRDELVAIFEGRALARWALGDEASAREDLVALRSLDPEHALSPEAPPGLAEAFADLPSDPIALELEWEEGPSSALVRAEIRSDPARLARAVRIHARRDGGPWQIAEQAELSIARQPGDVVEVWVEAVGPGGAIVAQNGTSRAPVEHRDESAAALGRAAASDATPIWIGVGVGAAVLVVVAIVVGVAVGTAQSDETRPRAPIVIGF